MITFICGKVYEFSGEHVILENNGIGYYINFNHPEILTLGEVVTIFTYQHFRDDATVLYGFADKIELDVFQKLISVKGLGPKTASMILGRCKCNDLVVAIENGDVAFLKTMPAVGTKTAQQIILDLKGKLIEVKSEEISVNNELDEAIEGLKSLGYKAYEINSIKGQLVKSDCKTTKQYLSEGLKLLNKRSGG
ncbi:MAG: Holliday junction branch migration protein RuvA [Bacillota bacterium]|jgi:Holliday junction DNA helicase RuvA|nr:Holliday junction branch migration protein RuvA [Bacillota bacterium]NLL26395.1 Holliday junction branch migration protein RuvA [Erysipelotrichia bacterium]